MKFIGLFFVNTIVDMAVSRIQSQIHNPALVNRQEQRQVRQQWIDEYHALKQWHYCVNYFYMW